MLNPFDKIKHLGEKLFREDRDFLSVVEEIVDTLLLGELKGSSSPGVGELIDVTKDIPVVKILYALYGLKEIWERLSPDEGLKSALTLAVAQAIFRTLEEDFGIGIKELSREDKITIKETVKEIIEEFERLPAEEFQVKNFDFNNFLDNNVVNKIFGIVEEKLSRIENFLSTSYGVPIKQFFNRLRLNSEIEFWKILEANQNKFQYLLESLNSRSKQLEFRKYKLELYYSEFLKRFEDEPLFGNEKGLTLKDIYVEQPFEVYNDSSFKEPPDDTYRNLVELLKEFIEDKPLKNLPNEEPLLVLVLGYPGHGKTSLSLKLIHDFKKGNIDASGNVYLIELRRILEKAEDIISKPLEVFRKHLGNEILGFSFNQGDVLILDGLDELIISERFSPEKAENFVSNLIREIKTKRVKLKVILTTRSGYIDIEKFLKREKNNALILHLGDFSDKQIETWLDKYERFYTEKKKYIDSLRKNLETLTDEKKKFLTLPVLLYITVSAEVDLGKITSTVDIYEQLIEWVVNRKWDELKEHYNLKGLTKEDLENLLKAIAFLMFKNKSEFAYADEIFQLEEFKKFGKEVFEEEPDGEEKYQKILRGLLIAFYLREFKASNRDSTKFAVEFYHKSIQEYLTAKYILTKLLEIGEKTSEGNCKISQVDAEKILEEIFSEKLTKEIRKYLYELIERIQQKEKDYLKESFNRIAFKIFPSLLEKDFIVTSLEGEKGALDRPLWFFKQLWNTLKKIQKVCEEDPNSIIERWRKETLRENFIRFLYRTYSILGYLEWFSLILEGLYLDLEKENLQNAFLKNLYLPEADLSEANISGADISSANFSGAKLSEANISGADISETNLSRANLSRADLSRADLSGANLSKADLSEVNLLYAKLLKTDLSRANLSEADLTRANLSRANLLWANLHWTNLSKANLTDANLERANLGGANLLEANLTGAKLTGADLRGAIFDVEQIKKARNWDKAIYDPEVRKKLGLP